jgi:hypothetical protein
VIASRFARFEGKCRFNSVTLNTKIERLHDDDKTMSVAEVKELKNAIKHW